MEWTYPHRPTASGWTAPPASHPFRILPEGYRYEPLGSPRMFRLLLLHPGQTSDQVECSLFRYSLYQCPVYTALSYVWGDSSNRHLLVLNSHLLEISQNLHIVLSQIRKQNEPILLWVDAICINQADLCERSQQVMIMRMIYESAESVIAWIGESKENSDLAMAFIANFTGSESDMGYMRQNVREQASETWTALCNLWSRPYWERVWVIQEVAVARNVQVVCGNVSISLDALERVILAVRKYIFDRFATAARQPRRLLRMIQVDQNPSIAEILWNMSYYKATDSRDKVYGILGIVPLAYRSQIVPDYTKSLTEVLRDVMIAYVHLESDLDILCHFMPYPLESGTPAPSWVPDITRVVTGLPPYLYSCSAGRQSTARFFDDNNTLVLKGMVIGTIDTMKGPFHASIDTDINRARLAHDEKESLRETEQLSLLSLRRKYRDNEGHSDEFRYRRFWAMLTGDRENSGSLCPYTCREVWAFLLLNRECSAEVEMRKYAAFMFFRLLDRCFFITAEGDIGLGPDQVQKGDLVCIFFGCSLCAIVRQKGGHQVYIGPAYVDGAMDGAYIRRLQDGCEDCHQIVDFVLR